MNPSEWIINALVTISAQLTAVLRQNFLIQRKLDALIAAQANIPPEQLRELEQESKSLKTKTDALAKAIEKNK